MRIKSDCLGRFVDVLVVAIVLVLMIFMAWWLVGCAHDPTNNELWNSRLSCTAAECGKRPG